MPMILVIALATCHIGATCGHRVTPPLPSLPSPPHEKSVASPQSANANSAMLRASGLFSASRRLVVAASAAVPRRFLSAPVPAWARPATFVEQHIGPGPAQREQMLKSMGYTSMDKFVEAAVPASLLSTHQLQIGQPLSEQEALAEFQAKISLNQYSVKSLIGQGYHGVVTPAVLQSRLLEDASWYTPYTPYQAEIAQGRLEMLLNYQTMIVELTGMQVSNASLLDEGTAAAEAMAMCRAVVGSKSGRNTLVIADACHPQSLSVIRTRAAPLGVDIVVCPSANVSEALLSKAFAVFYSYPTTDGRAVDLTSSIASAHTAGAKAIVAVDPLALTLMKPPGEMGADVVVGSAQRFGVPMFFGGPHAGILAASTAFTRQMPGRIVGVTRDTQNRVALRLSLATRENHIRREKATSNICTAQALLANTAAAYAIFHGPEGLKQIALRVNGFAKAFAAAVVSSGAKVNDFAFDTVAVTLKDKAQADAAVSQALASGYNIRRIDDVRVAVAFDETVVPADVEKLAASMAKAIGAAAPRVDFSSVKPGVAAALARSSPHLKSPIFSSVGNEHEMVRYLESLARKDISLVHSMMPLGSCTMKLNAQAEMLPLKWASVQQLHPFVPSNQAQGYAKIIDDLKRFIGDITGLPEVSLQPNSGAAGEYAGLLVMREYHLANGAAHRNVCLIPRSAHGTNPASAAMANLKIIVIDSLDNGDIDLAHLRKCVQENFNNLCGIMVTYPSTHGVYEETIRPLTTEVHAAGGLVYMDGANMNAQVGVMRPAEFGVDVLHLNLHKTFCIPHGGGGPGVGPIAVTKKLGPYLPSHEVVPVGGEFKGTPYAVSSAPWGSAGILPISWMYMKMMGGPGLKASTIQAVMNANYMAERLREHYSISYTGANGRVAHEFILDIKPLKAKSGITEVDIAKRLMDYGFHAPTMSWPVPGSLMVEPTESEPLAELDRFCDALIQIRHEVADVESGKLHKTNNPLRNAPHTQADVVTDAWDRPYSREQAAFPLPWVLGRKVWPTVSRVDDTWGDKNFMCTCPTPDEMAAQSNQ